MMYISLLALTHFRYAVMSGRADAGLGNFAGTLTEKVGQILTGQDHHDSHYKDVIDARYAHVDDLTYDFFPDQIKNNVCQLTVVASTQPRYDTGHYMKGFQAVFL